MEPSRREDEILRAADRVVRRMGYEKVTMDDIAKEAGISRATLYRSFRDKMAVFRTQTDYWIRRFRADVEGIQAEELGHPEKLEKILMKSIQHLTDPAHQLPDFQKGFFSGVETNLSRLHPFYETCRGAVESTLIDGISASAFESDVPDKTAESLVHLIKSLQLLVIASNSTRAETLECAGRLVRIAVRGIIPQDSVCRIGEYKSP